MRGAFGLCAATALGLSTPSCGDPLATDDVQGTPSFVASGALSQTEYARAAPTGERLRVALFWVPDGLRADEIATGRALAEQPGSGTTLRAGGGFGVRVFGAPEPGWTVDGIYALGRVAAYADRDDDGRRDDEPLVALDAGESPTGRALPAGFHSVVLPILCSGATRPAPTGDCDVPLGLICGAHGQCNAGRCSENGPLRACALPAGGRCVPENGLLAFVEGRPAARLAPGE